MKQRVLSALLCMVLLFGLLPLHAANAAEPDRNRSGAPMQRKENTVNPETDTFDANENEGMNFRLASTIEPDLPNLLLSGVTWGKADGTSVPLQDADYKTRWGNAVLLKKEFLLRQAPGTYTVTWNMEEGNSPTATVVIPETWKISLSAAPESTGTINIGHTVLWEPIYYVTKGAAVTFHASPNNEQLFVCWKLDEQTVSSDEAYTFTPQSDCHLEAVFEAERYGLTVTPEQVDFGSFVLGTLPEAKTCTVENTGNMELELERTGSAFCDMGALSTTFLAPGQSAQFTIRPKSGLDVERYAETVRIYGQIPTPLEGEDESKIEAVLNIRFAITPPPAEHSVSVEGGTVHPGAAVKGTTVTLTADDPPEGMAFDRWEILSGNLTLEDKNAAKTRFTMPDEEVRLKAIYKQAAADTELPDTGAQRPAGLWLAWSTVSLAGIGLFFLLNRRSSKQSRQ